MRWPPSSDWPHASHSEQVLCRPHRWHVQRMGQGSSVLLLHGTGGSTHSFRDLMPRLAEKHDVIAVDLPGQGMTQLGARHRSGLRQTVDDLASLCRAQNWQPSAIVGHSAGAAIALQLARQMPTRPAVVGINAALGNFKGMAGVLFPVMAKMLAMTPFTSVMFSRGTGTQARVRALIEGTGSYLSAPEIELYRRLIADPDHVDGALLMMAQWNLDALLASLDDIDVPVLLLTGSRDKAVPPATSDRAAARLPNAVVHHIDDGGHLVHEERPALVAACIEAFLTRAAGASDEAMVPQAT